MNTYTKGNRVERMFRMMMEDKGWITWKPSRAKFNSNDIFGLFDCLCIRGESVALFQIKSHSSDFYSARKQIAKWIDTYKIKSTIAGCVLYEGKGEWRVEVYDGQWIKYLLT